MPTLVTSSRIRARLLVAMLCSLPLAPSLAAQQTTSVSLEEALRLAERVQPLVISAQANLRDAGAQVTAARGQFLPQVGASSNLGTSFAGIPSRVDPTTGQPISGSSNSTLSAGLSASVDLFTGFRRGADLRAAHATEDAATAGLVDSRYQVRLTTTQQFFSALAAVELTRVREASVERAQEQLKISIAKLAAGSATRADSLQSLVTLGTAQLDLISTRAATTQAEASLARLIGADGLASAKDDSAFYHVVGPVDTAALQQEAASRSPQVQSAIASASAARANLASARSAYWPTLSLGGSTNWNGSTSRGGPVTDLFNQRQVNLTLSWALFNRFNRETNITIREGGLDLAEATSVDTRRQVTSALTGQLALLQAAVAEIDITNTSVSAAEENLRVQRERYRVGVATIVDVLTAQEALTQAEVNVVNARFDYLRAKAQIEALIGRSL
ncbi:MAG: TolC family protein [Gemmatimonadota bacterium]